MKIYAFTRDLVDSVRGDITVCIIINDMTINLERTQARNEVLLKMVKQLVRLRTNVQVHDVCRGFNKRLCCCES